MNERPRAFLDWAIKTFGPIASRRDERTMRFVEEALELAHAEGLDRDTITRIADRVYSREPGKTRQEIGQAQATLECLAANLGISADRECEIEFARVRSIPQAEWDRRHAAKVALNIAT